MSRDARYTTFDSPDRLSWPSEEVARRLTSAWLLECCCSRCCYPWKRRLSRYPQDKSGSTKNSKKDDGQLETIKSLEASSRTNKSDTEESSFNLNSVENYQRKKETGDEKKIRIEETLVDSEDDDVEEINRSEKDFEFKDHSLDQSLEKSSEKVSSKRKSEIESNLKIDSSKGRKPFLRKFSLDIRDRKKNDRQVFRKYSLDANEAQNVLSSGDCNEPGGSPLFKRCVSFKNKSFKSKGKESGDKKKTKCQELSGEMKAEKEKEQKVEGVKVEKENEEEKGLFESDSDSEAEFEFSDGFFADNPELRIYKKDSDEEVQDQKPARITKICKSGVVSVLPQVREAEEEFYSSNDDGSSLSEACSTPIIGAGSRTISSHAVMDMDDIDRSLHSGHLATRASLSSLGARSDSMASVYSGAGEGRWCCSVAVRGEVEFSLQYDYKQLTFEVHVTQCRDLAPVDVKRNRSDPYVKVYLLPDKSKSGKRKTKVKKHTLNPVFDETLKFHMSLNGLETRTLWLTVWHSDMFGRNDFLGEVRMPLENKIFDDPRPQWYPLQERTEPFDDPIAYKGEVIVGLKFVPPDPTQQERDRETGTDHRGKARKNWSRGALHVLVKEARNLQTRAKHTGSCDPFCKSYLLPDKGRSGKQKTGVVRRSGGSPVWNHTFVYKDVSLQELAERGLELTVWDHDRIASNEFLGGVRFNLGTGKNYGKLVDWMDATGRELSLWQSMLERPNFWVEGAVTLRPNLHNHGKNGSS